MTATKIRQSDFATTHKLTPGEVKVLREKHLTEGSDFWSEGRAIYWTEEAAELIALKLSPPTGELADAVREIFKDSPETLTVRVTRPCRNKRMAYADLNGTKIAVNIGRNRDKMLKKMITVRKDADGENYTYVP